MSDSGSIQAVLHTLQTNNYIAVANAVLAAGALCAAIYGVIKSIQQYRWERTRRVRDAERGHVPGKVDFIDRNVIYHEGPGDFVFLKLLDAVHLRK